jgi:predicted kinase
LANIVRIANAPVLFDCLEFNEEYACIDVLYDLAFLVMDLLDRDLAEHSQRLLQGWIDQTNDDASLALLPLFLATRAIVRAKVIAFGAVGCTDEAERRRRADNARTYFALAHQALAPPPARLIAIGGRSGTGKSALAMSLAPGVGALPGAIVLRSDVIRKTLLGEAPTRRLGADAYTPDVSARVYARIAERARALLGAGHCVIADAVFGSSQERALIENAATNLSVPFTGLWLTAPEAVLEARVAARRNDASDANARIVRSQRSVDCLDPWLHVASDRPLGEVRDDASRALRLASSNR